MRRPNEARSVLALRTAVLLVAGATCALGCAWDRFDDLKVDAPVEALAQPTTIPSGFGATLGMVSDGVRTSVFVGGPQGSSGAAVFRLGEDEAPDVDAVDTAHCQRSGTSRTCVLADQAAGLLRAPGGANRTSCYVAGPGVSDSESGLFARCSGGAEFVFPVPADIEQEVVAPVVAGELSPRVALGVSKEAEPVLVAGVGESRRAFYYEQASLDPVDLALAGNPPASFGAAVAVFSVSGGWVLAVGAPKSAEVRLFRTDGSGAFPIGCLTGRTDFGLGLSAGDLDGDGQEDLAVSGDSLVEVYSGEFLGSLAQNDASDCQIERSQDELLLVGLACEASEDVEGCSRSKFGSGVQIADFDGDGRAEVAVGAPELSVRGQAKAGAVEVFDASGSLVDVRFPSDPSEGGRFGEVLIQVPQKGRSILVVGEPGAEAASVFYCTGAVGAGKSDRCE